MQRLRASESQHVFSEVRAEGSVLAMASYNEGIGRAADAFSTSIAIRKDARGYEKWICGYKQVRRDLLIRQLVVEY